METQEQLIERAAQRAGLNYTQLGRRLGVTRQAVSQYRQGAPMAPAVALRLAEVCGRAPEYVLACVDYSAALRRGNVEEAFTRARIIVKLTTVMPSTVIY